MEILARKAEYREWDDIPKDARPVVAYERDETRALPTPLIGVYVPAQVRCRVVKFISPDQNSVYEVVDYLGPWTGETGTLIPCEGSVEMSQITEILDGAIARNRERRAAREGQLVEKTKSIRDRAQQLGLQLVEEKASRSVIGPLHRVQRSS